MKPTGDKQKYWRSLDQLADTDRFKEFLYREFPRGTAELASNSWSRRSFLTTMGASLALAGLTGCRRPVEKIVPYVTRPEEIDPGVPNKYATTMPLGVSAYGVIVTTHNGRPTFIEGNSMHSSSQGAVNPIVQASLLDLYDPDRSKNVRQNGRESTWDDFTAWWQELYAKYAENGGEGLAVLSETFNSPTLVRLKRQFEETFPLATWVAWEPISDENIYQGVKTATGQLLQPVYDFSRAKTVLALDCDFLGTESEAIAHTRGFADGRRVMVQQDEMSRLYVVEPSMTVTGMAADHRLPLHGGGIGSILRSLVPALTARGIPTGLAIGTVPSDNPDTEAFAQAVSGDLSLNRGECLIVAGRRQPPEVHAVCMALNDALGNLGKDKPLRYAAIPDAVPSSTDGLGLLANDLTENKVETLIVIGGNPAATAPSMKERLSKAANVVHLSSRVDETSQLASWHLPLSHYLECWGDARSADGTGSVSQPMIAPLYETRSAVDFIGQVVTGEGGGEYAAVHATWASVMYDGDQEDQWRRILHDGVQTPGGLVPVGSTRTLSGRVAEAQAALESGIDETGIELSLLPGGVFDGRYANNGWLQELPDPVTKLTWGNAALISPKLADEYGLENEDVVEIDVGGRKIEIPVWISPGQADNSISVALGYGRIAAGRVGNGVGVDAYTLRATDNMWFAGGVSISKTGRKQEMACTQDHGSMEGRPIIRENTLAAYKKRPEFFPAEIEHPEPLALWDEHRYDEGYQWGMSIDLNACTGCSACVIACQAENNIPVIGKEQVRNGREMHWMRLDRYYAGDTDNPEVAVQPMNCQHCEMAPCEQVCPVAATNHDDEGLNVMVYNRCIGTRYCSNNCPYKVRRFNFFNYTNDLPETVQMAQNPEVTVRFRGVMEKCTYCVQRIAIAKINAKNNGRTVADGEITTACQTACPANAIVFGNINDPDSQVSKMRANNRKYRVLEELNTRPRTTYMAKLRNPNPLLAPERKPEDESHHG